MITNKDLSIDSKNGQVILNGDKYDLGTQGEIDAAVKDVYSVMGQMGAKNLIPYPYYETTKTQNGVNFTNNGDGSITVDTAGEASTGNAIFFCQTPSVVSSLITLDKNKTYILSDATKSGVASTYTLGIRYFAEGVVPSTSTGTAIICNSSNNWQAEISNAVSAYVYIYVYSGKTVNNITFKPMLRIAADTDSTYQPYAKTNKELTEVIGDLSGTGVTGVTVADQIEAVNDDIASRAIRVKASSSDTKTFTIPKTVWSDNGLTGSNHTAMFSGGYNGRISCGFIGTNGSTVTAIKLGDNTVTASILDDNIVLTFNDTVYTDLWFILFN